MIPFTFKVSIKRNSVHFFPKGDQYPFFLVSNIDNQYFLVEAAIQKTFDRLLTLQQQIKKRNLNEQRVDNLLVEINNYFIGTDAAWLRTYEYGKDKYDFQVFSLVSRQKLMQPQFINIKNFTDDRELNPPKKIRTMPDLIPDDPKQTVEIFRPWE